MQSLKSVFLEILIYKNLFLLKAQDACRKCRKYEGKVSWTTIIKIYFSINLIEWQYSKACCFQNDEHLDKYRFIITVGM